MLRGSVFCARQRPALRLRLQHVALLMPKCAVSRAAAAGTATEAARREADHVRAAKRHAEAGHREDCLGGITSGQTARRATKASTGSSSLCCCQRKRRAKLDTAQYRVQLDIIMR